MTYQAATSSDQRRWPAAPAVASAPDSRAPPRRAPPAPAPPARPPAAAAAATTSPRGLQGRARLACRRWWLVCRRLNGVVPLAVELVPCQRHRCQLLITHLDPEWVAAAVQLRPDPQARAGGGRPDQLDDHLMAFQRAAPPVHRDRAAQPVLDPVPLGGPRRQVTHGDLKPGLGGEPGQLGLPCPDPVAVGTTSVGT